VIVNCSWIIFNFPRDSTNKSKVKFLTRKYVVICLYFYLLFPLISTIITMMEQCMKMQVSELGEATRFKPGVSGNPPGPPAI